MFIGRKLKEAEVDAYDVLPLELAKKVWVFQLPKLRGPFAGITLGRLVLVARPVGEKGTSKLLAHELVHVRQWSELGFAGYLWLSLIHI